jgi:gentisate 1,2-dioxygenase
MITTIQEPFIRKIGKLPKNMCSTNKDARIYEYMQASNPIIPSIGVFSFHPDSEMNNNNTIKTSIIPFNLNKKMCICEYDATSPNLMVNSIHINRNEQINTHAIATSQTFYIMKGSGFSFYMNQGIQYKISWNQGDLFVMPAHNNNNKNEITHTASEDSRIYWITDEPLLQYLGVYPNVKKFEPTLFQKKEMYDCVEELKHSPDNKHKNRLGVLLGNKATDISGTLTLTHTMWSLLNVLPAKQTQPPHRHNSVALDIAVSCGSEGVYTLMGKELDENGWVKDPVKVTWIEGGMFTTPPGWWHSHHNETDKDAYVLPIQDAGIYTYQRTLDIQFSKAKML